MSQPNATRSRGFEHRRATRVSTAVATVLTLLTIPSAPSAAQTASATALKAAFVYNFAGFVEWPSHALPADAPLVFCVAGDARVAAALEEIARKGRVVRRHTSVRRIDAESPLTPCHVLYVSDHDTTGPGEVVARLADLPVFTVSDLSGFTESGGVAHLFVEGDRMRFAINVAAAKRSRLLLSSRLLALASTVRDVSDAPRPD